MRTPVIRIAVKPQRAARHTSTRAMCKRSVLTRNTSTDAGAVTCLACLEAAIEVTGTNAMGLAAAFYRGRDEGERRNARIACEVANTKHGEYLHRLAVMLGRVA